MTGPCRPPGPSHWVPVALLPRGAAHEEGPTGLQAGSCIQSCREGTRRKCGRPAVGPAQCCRRSPAVGLRWSGTGAAPVWGHGAAQKPTLLSVHCCASQPVYFNAPRRVHLTPVVLGGPLEDSCALCSLAREVPAGRPPPTCPGGCWPTGRAAW